MIGQPLDHDREPRDPLAAEPAVAPLDWTQLLAPVSSAAPSGPNLEYSAEFAALELLASGTPDRHMGASLAAGQAPDPRAVLQRGAELLQRTKDVRVLVLMLAACVPVLGVRAFASGLGALQQLLEQLWDTLHPGLDPDDEGLATARANATMACASPELVLALRRAPLIESRSGRLSLEEALLAAREPGGAGGNPAAERLRSALHELPHGQLAALVAALRAGLTHATAIPELFAARSAAVPNLHALQAFFRDALAVLRQHRAAEDGTPAPAASDPRGASEPPSALDVAVVAEATTMTSAAITSPAVTPIAARNCIHSRDDVREALEAICAYYRVHEPASPLPLLLGRCQRLVGLDFLATLRELAPEAVDKIVLISGASGA